MIAPVDARPDIPKRFASRLRRVYAKLTDVRSSIAYGEAEIVYLNEYLAYYAADPQKFADRHYPGHAVNSYPVTTHIGRSWERLYYRERRVPEYYAELPSVEAAAIEAEMDVLDQLGKMRANTLGREPWPKAPLPLAILQKSAMQESTRELKKYLKYVAEHAERRQQREAKRKEKLSDSIKKTEQLWADTLAAMPPAKAAAYSSFWNAMRESLSAGTLSAESISDIGSGLDAEIQNVLERTQQVLVERAKSENTANGEDQN